MIKEILLARYDDLSLNPNDLKRFQAEELGHSYVEERLVTAVGRTLFEGYVSAEVVRVKGVEIRPLTPTRGGVVAICEPLKIMHRRLKNGKRKQHHDTL